MKEKERKALYDTLSSLKIGTIIKAIFEEKEEYYIVNDKGNFCELGFLDYGVILRDESHIDNIHCYFCMDEIKSIEMYSGEELARIKTVLLEIFFGITKSEYDLSNINLKEMQEKVEKLKKLLN